MKNKRIAAAMVMSFMLAGTVLMGCGGKPQETGTDASQNTSQETQKDMGMEETESGAEEMQGTESGVGAPETEAIVETPETETMESVTEKYEDNFAVDSQVAKAFAEKIKDATVKKDLEALAELTAFPVYVGLPDVDVVETKEDFLALGADTVFTEELVKSVEAADIENFEPSMAGFSISDGGPNINFGVSADGTLGISGINY